MRIGHLRAVAAAAGVAAVLGSTALASASAAAVRSGDVVRSWPQTSQIRHVLLLSVDGLHQHPATDHAAKAEPRRRSYHFCALTERALSSGYCR
jgi:hypothetical protein